MLTTNPFTCIQMKYNLLEYVPRELKNLYKYLELDFHPLKLNARVSTALKWINDQTKEPELRQYIEPLQKVVICRVLQQVCVCVCSAFI